jgi:lysophospholipase L1-like esterase
MEDYLTVCVPQYEVTVRQYGWSGERANGFLARMTNDCLRFSPTLATTCYGMNDHEYRPYEPRIGEAYRKYSDGILRAFQANDVRVIQGSPGPVGKMPSWVKTATGTVHDLNLSLYRLRNIGIELAREDKTGFADVFWPMFNAGITGQLLYGPDYAIAGKDGVHPGWAGQAVMAYAFLKAMGLDGKLAEFKVDLKHNRLIPSAGHTVIEQKEGEFVIESTRYPFCACLPDAKNYPNCGPDDLGRDNTIRSALTLIPFDADLNRFMLVVKGLKPGKYRVTWGGEVRSFPSAELKKGVNLAVAFPSNPFSKAFARVDEAVAAKQAYETKQVKEVFHGAEGKANMEAAVARTEAERTPLAAAIRTAFVPVRHTLKIEAE